MYGMRNNLFCFARLFAALMTLSEVTVPVFLTKEMKEKVFLITQFLANENKYDAYISKYCETRSDIIIAAFNR